MARLWGSTVLLALALLESLPSAAWAGLPPLEGAAAADARFRLEHELLAHLQGQDPALANTEEQDLELLQLCVSRSWWAAARELVARAHRRGAAQAGTSGIKPIKDEVTKLLSALKHDADEFAAFAESTYRGQTKGLDEVYCALQWAQNSSTVFLGVKYAARWSAPGAIEVRDLSVNISSCCVELNAFGHHSSIRKRYLVDLGLYDDVASEISSWSSSSVGRLTATIHKARPARWPRLTKAKSKSRHQIGTWLDMEERWADELKKNTDPAAKDKGAKKAKEKDAEKEKQPRGKKGERVYTPFEKEVRKVWKRLRKALRNPKKLAADYGVPAALGLALLFFCLCGRAPPSRSVEEVRADAAWMSGTELGDEKADVPPAGASVEFGQAGSSA